MYEQEFERHRATESSLRQSVLRERDLLRQKDELILQKDELILQKDELILQKEILAKESEHRFLNDCNLSRACSRCRAAKPEIPKQRLS